MSSNILLKRTVRNKHRALDGILLLICAHVHVHVCVRVVMTRDCTCASGAAHGWEEQHFEDSFLIENAVSIRCTELPLFYLNYSFILKSPNKLRFRISRDTNTCFHGPKMIAQIFLSEVICNRIFVFIFIGNHLYFLCINTVNLSHEF